MEYLDGYLENIMFTLPSLFLFIGGYYVNRTQYQKNNIILKNIEKVKLDVDDVKSRDHKNLKNEIKKLKENHKKETERLLNTIEELSLKIIDKNKRIDENDKKIEEYDGLKLKLRDLEKKSQENKQVVNNGNGTLRYKNKEGTIFYHGMGHLENKYSWWEPYMHRKFCGYTDVNRKLKFPLFETHNVDEFCNNHEYCVEINKNKRVVFYYECKGHKINVD
tara:strand:+ start:2915 stop:3574 length:660 start_codon:yes stop_codon:yes gene_type:complete